MSHANVQQELLQFIALLLESQLISNEQKEALEEFVVESLPFYQNNPALVNQIEEIATELASISRPNMSPTDAKEAVSPNLVQRVLDLPKASVHLDALNSNELSEDARLSPFVGIGLLRTLGGKFVSHNGSPALFSTLLARLSYSKDTLLDLAQQAKRHTDKQVSTFFSQTREKFQAIPAALRRNIVLSANRVAHSFLTSDYQTAGALPEMLNIYEFGRSFYFDRFDSLFVFSNTSGLVVPSEHMGAIDRDNLRRSYFNDAFLGLDARDIKRYYQWDSIKTAEELYKNFQIAEKEGREKQYVLQSKEILTRFLQEPNLEITEAEFGSSGFGIKLLLPIIGRSGVMFSNRHPTSKRIAYANLLSGVAGNVFLSKTLSQFTSMPIENKWSHTVQRQPRSRTALTYSEAIKELVYETEITQQIKGLNQILDAHVAGEIIEQLLDRGKSISENKKV